LKVLCWAVNEAVSKVATAKVIGIRIENSYSPHPAPSSASGQWKKRRGSWVMWRLAMGDVAWAIGDAQWRMGNGQCSGQSAVSTSWALSITDHLLAIRHYPLPVAHSPLPIAHGLFAIAHGQSQHCTQTAAPKRKRPQARMPGAGM
jgi:hypothetical protein